jgi:short-subunit dehydrogenase
MTSTTNKPLAVVTGASSGIGLELAKQFAENGYDLVIVAEDNELDAAASSLRDLGAQVDSVHTDLARAGGVEELVERVAEAARPVAAAALNAGVGVNGAFVGETKLEDHLREVDLNVRSTVHLAYLLLPWMVQAGEGRMLFTSSIAATTPGPFMAVYNASKAFVKSFAEAVREELRDTGVTVTTLMPGPTDTEFFDRAGMRDTKLGQSEKDSATRIPPPRAADTARSPPCTGPHCGFSGSWPSDISRRRQLACPWVGSRSSRRSASTRSTTERITRTSCSSMSVRRLRRIPSTCCPVGVPAWSGSASVSGSAERVRSQSLSSREDMFTTRWNSFHSSSSTRDSAIVLTSLALGASRVPMEQRANRSPPERRSNTCRSRRCAPHGSAGGRTAHRDDIGHGGQ